jgi:hypothetical protein
MDHRRCSTVKIIPIIVAVEHVAETVPILPTAVLEGGLVSGCEGAGASETGNPTVGKGATASVGGSRDAFDVVGDDDDTPKGDAEGDKFPLGTLEGKAEGKSLPLGLEITSGDSEMDGKELMVGLDIASGDSEVECEELILGLEIAPGDVDVEGNELMLGLEKASGVAIMFGDVDDPLGATIVGSPTPEVCETVGVIVNAGFGAGFSDGEGGNVTTGVEGTEGSDGTGGRDGDGGGEGGFGNLGIDIADGFFGDLDFP